MNISRLRLSKSHEPSDAPLSAAPRSPRAPPQPPRTERTFSDGDYHRGHQQERIGAAGGSDGNHEEASGQRSRHDSKGRTPFENNTFGAKKAKRPRGRWSYMLQDIPESIAAALNDVNKGYAMRVTMVVGVTVGVGALLYYGVIVPRQERKPLAQRWSLLSPRVPITLLEKNREESSCMYTYRFALPHAYDYAGYAPVSSVRLYSGRVRELSSLNRWYTPISLPDERGFIEFAIKDCDPGRMSSRLRYLEPGDVVYLGRWIKEFDYKAVKEAGGEMGLVCTTAGASVALQIMKIMEQEEKTRRSRWHSAARSSSPSSFARGQDAEGEAAAGDEPRPTRLQLLYCHQSARDIPFKKAYFDRLEASMPDRISVKYNVLSMGTRNGPGAGGEDPSLVVGKNCFIGHLDPEILQAALPPPVRTEALPGSSGGSSGTSAAAAGGGLRVTRPHILVCGPQSMMSFLCGRVSPISNFTYWQGWWFRYGGFMKDMGYERSQVYKFGVSTHFLAIH